MRCIGNLSRVEFRERDLFERKDFVHNDGTNDSYKHFFQFQYFHLLTKIFEAIFIISLEGDAEEIVNEIKKEINRIERVHGVKIV
jgi:hypothetical protein